MTNYKNVAIIIALLSSLIYKAQNSYHESTYARSNASILSSGVTATFTTPGFILAGYDPNSVNYNFTIDRPNKGGTYVSSAWEFRKEYQISADISGNCVIATPYTQISTCHGVSVIETDVTSIQARYALVAAFDEGCCITFLTSNGSPINTNIFYLAIPSGATGITKPMIIEDPNNAGEYFICGSYNQIMYAARVDINGIIWSKTYPIVGEPKALKISAGGGPLVVGATDISGTTKDGFIMFIAPTTGNTGFFKAYDVAGFADEFSTIIEVPVSPVHYMVGGTAETQSGTSKLYTGRFSLIFVAGGEHVIGLNTDITAGDFVEIVRRPITNGAEYYGVTTTTAGIGVVRMDAIGVPSFTGWGSPLDEFIYNAPGTNLTATGLSFFDNVVGYDEGLHIFGTDLNSGTAAPYLAQAYFSGHNGCTTPTFHSFSSTVNSTATNYISSVSAATGLSACFAISLAGNTGGSDMANCGPNTSVSGGSNARMSSVSISENVKVGIKVYPNPVTNIASIIFDSNSDVRTIVLYDNIGRLVKHIDIDKKAKSEATVELNFRDLQLQSGIYYLLSSTEYGKISEKIIYEKQD